MTRSRLIPIRTHSAVRLTGALLALAVAPPRRYAARLCHHRGADRHGSRRADSARHDRHPQRADRSGRRRRRAAGRRQRDRGAGTDGLSRAHRHGDDARRRCCAAGAARHDPAPPRRPSGGSAATILRPQLEAADARAGRCAGTGASGASRHHERARDASRQVCSRARARSSTSSRPADDPQIGARRRSAPRAAPSSGRRSRCTSRSAAAAAAAAATRCRCWASSRSSGRPSSTPSTSSSRQQHYERTKDRRRPSRLRAGARCHAAGARPARCQSRSRPTLSREILRALTMAKEFKLEPIITGAREADEVAADLKAQNARVISASTSRRARARWRPTPTRRSATLRERAQAPKTPAALEQGGRAVRVLVGRPSRSRATSSATPRAR